MGEYSCADFQGGLDPYCVYTAVDGCCTKSFDLFDAKEQAAVCIRLWAVYLRPVDRRGEDDQQTTYADFAYSVFMR